jgi:F-type H+-transporting ATPase subunit c
MPIEARGDNVNKFLSVLPVAVALLALASPALAQDASPAHHANTGAGIAMGFAVLGGGIAQGLTAKGMLESVSRNPQAASKLNAPYYVGLAFIESLCLFALVVAFTIAR